MKYIALVEPALLLAMYTKERTHLLAKSDIGSGLGIVDKSGRHQRVF